MGLDSSLMKMPFRLVSRTTLEGQGQGQPRRAGMRSISEPCSLCRICIHSTSNPIRHCSTLLRIVSSQTIRASDSMRPTTATATAIFAALVILGLFANNIRPSPCTRTVDTPCFLGAGDCFSSEHFMQKPLVVISSNCGATWEFYGVSRLLGCSRAAPPSK